MNAPTLIDTTTLEDLEVFGRTTGGGLFGLIDQTTTLRGRAALRRRLERPSSSVAEIQATQEAVRFFYENPIAWPIDHAGETAVFKYIESNISLGARTRAGEHAERVWLSLRYPDILRELGDGLSDTAGFFSCVRQVCAEIQRMNPPSRVASLVSQLKATSDAVAGSMQHGSLLRRDRELRTGARQSIAEALELVGEVDALRAMGCATRELGLTFPELVEADSFLLEAEGVFHPFVEEPVRNRVLLTGDQPMVFLTGPNMAASLLKPAWACRR